MARKFNPLAAYGTVSPPHQGAVYYQDGGYFNSAGELVFEDRPATPPKIEVNEVTTVDTTTGETTTETIKTEVPAGEPGEPKEILAAWLRGEHVLPFQTARKLVKEGFGTVLANKHEIIDFLVNKANLVPAEQVKVD